MKSRKNNLDERQEQQLLKIEHNGCWLAFWALLLSIFVQLILYPGDWRPIAGEWLVFMALSIYILAACVRRGIWDRRLQPNAKTNLLASLIAGAAVIVFFFVFTYLRYHKVQASAWASLLLGLGVFALCFLGLTVFSRIARRREKELNAEPAEEEQGQQPMK